MAEQSEKREQFSDSSESNSSQPRRKKRRFSDDPQDPHDAYWQKIREKGKTNVTVQKRCLQLRADTLYQKHYYDVIVFFHSCVPGRETDRHIFDYYGTPGSGRLFLKDAENEKSQSHGATVLRALKRFYYEQPPSERTTGSSSVNPAAARDGPSTEPTNSESVNPAAARARPSAKPTNSEPVNPAASRVRLSAKPSNSESVNPAAACAGPSAKPTNSDSVNPAAARVRPSAKPTNSEPVNPAAARARPSAKPTNCDSVHPAAARERPSTKPTNSDSVDPAATCAGPSAKPTKSDSVNPAAEHPQPSTKSTNSGSDNPTEMLVYKVNNKVVAGGYEQRGRSMIHGCPIPTGHVCMMVTSVQGDHVPPCILGDPSENGKLFNGGFFAFPVEALSLVSMNPDGSVRVRPYNS